jgi:uncharacterized protein YggU (UPF0235/DUF167 family)
MAKKDLEITDGRLGAAITVHIQADGKDDRIAAINPDGTLVIQLACIPVQTKLNQQLIQYLASILQVPIDRIEIVAGENGYKKIVSILDVSAAYVNQEITKRMK